jgi:DNA-binding PadR family transcriptional regulator
MSVRLVILGLLRDRPLYGYEIKQIIEEHMSDWTSIAFGSIYFALDKLAEEKFVEKVEVEQKGKRPSRSVYQITDTGRIEFLRLLRSTWSELEREYFRFDLGLAFMDSLPEKEVRAYLQKRITQLEQILTYLDEHQKEEMMREDVPARSKAIFEHSRVHLIAELAWSRDLLLQVERGELK